MHGCRVGRSRRARDRPCPGRRCARVAAASASAIGDGSFTTDECHRDLSLERVGDADDGDFGDAGMRLHRLLDLARTQPVAGDVDHVVGASEHEVVAVGVARRPVERRIGDACRETSRNTSARSARSSPQTVVMHPGGSGGSDRQHAFFAGRRLPSPVASSSKLHVVAARPETTDCRTCAACPRCPAAPTGSASRFRSASSCRRCATPSASARPARGRLVERLAGEKQVAQRRQVVPSS